MKIIPNDYSKLLNKKIRIRKSHSVDTVESVENCPIIKDCGMAEDCPTCYLVFNQMWCFSVKWAEYEDNSQ